MRLLLAAAAFGLAARAAAAPLPKDLRLLDPGRRTSAEWAIPPGHGKGCRLVVDPGGAPWLGCASRWLVGPAYAVLYVSAKPFDSLAWLATGELAAGSGEDLGVLAVAAAAKAGKSTAMVPFVRLKRFPGREVAVYPAEGAGAYVVARGREGSDVLFLTWTGSDWSLRPVVSTSRGVSAAAGDGKRTFLAFGRRVVGVERQPDGKIAWQALFDHPSADVVSLSWGQWTGLTYGTASGAGFLGSRYWFEFLRAPGAEYRQAGGSLFVLPRGGGVVKIGGLGAYLEDDQAYAQAGAESYFDLEKR